MKCQVEKTVHDDKRQKVAWQLSVIGSNIRNIRKERGLSQEQLAERAELEWRSVQRFEVGKSNILTTTMLRLLKALGCHFEDLVSGTADKDWEQAKKS